MDEHGLKRHYQYARWDEDRPTCPGLPNPPTSPTLSFSFPWGFIKSKVYATQHTSIGELNQRIQVAFNEITVDFLQKLGLEYRERLNLLVECGGSRIEVRNQFFFFNL